MNSAYQPKPASRDWIFKGFLYGALFGWFLGHFLLSPQTKHPDLRFPFGALIGGLIGLTVGVLDRFR